jgi:alcohol dehydrogenase class IV
MEQFGFPTTIFYHQGALEALVQHLQGQGAKRLLLVTDAGLVRVGLAERIGEALSAGGISTEVFADVHANPIEEDLERGSAMYRAGAFDGIVGLGGGSPLDAAKAIGVLATHDGPIARFDWTNDGEKQFVHPLPPIYAIPTTAGTGSEVGRAAVIVVKETKTKTVILHREMLPKIAVLAPELTTGLPPHLTAATGMDAFTHCLEAYLSVGYHPMCDAIGLAGMEIILKALPIAVEDGSNVEARAQMLMAASMGATAFQKGLGVVHSLAHPLSTWYHMHHGLANALLLAPALEYQLNHREKDFTHDLRHRYQRVVDLFPSGVGKNHTALPGLILQFNERLGITGNVADHGLKKEDVPMLATEAFHDPCHPNNPIPMTQIDLMAMYSEVL